MGKSISRLGTIICGFNRVVINGRVYMHKKQLGEGAFSYVDLVQDCSTGRNYALKRIICHDQKSEDEGVAEAKVHKILTHNNLIECIDYCIKKKGPHSEVWVLLPFYTGGTLWDKFQQMKKENRTFSEAKLLKIFLQVARGVEAIHNKGYTHRDLKPANILLDGEDKCVVCDLGSCHKGEITIQNKRDAQALQDLAAEKSTLPYRAPELFQVEVDDKIDSKTDIWSLGCILYSFIYLEGPFDQHWLRGDSVHLAIQSLKFDKTKLQNYSEEISTLINDCIYHDPEFRPDARSIVQRIENLL